MRSTLLSIILSFVFLSPMFAASPESPFRTWKAGERVTMKAVEEYGIGRCFVAGPIGDDVFRRMRGKTFPAGCTVPRSSLRYVRVLHYTLDGGIRLGEIVCDKSIAADLTTIFRQLFDARYPIESIRLMDDYDADDERAMAHNNTSCFNFRYVAGTRVLSNHSYGKAIDLNPLYNPYVRRRKNGTTDVSPESGRKYADRSKTFDYKIDCDDLAYKLFTKHGFTWGGAWRSLKDYQHFEKK